MKIATLSSVYNEESYIKEFFTQLTAKWDKEHAFFIDDGSTDKSLNILTSLTDEKHILKNVHNVGQGLSLLRSMVILRNMGYDYIITLDSDLQHDPNSIAQFLKILSDKNSVDFVVGSRYLGERLTVGYQPPIRFLVNQLFCQLFYELYGQQTTDCFSGYLLFNTATIEEVTITNHRYSWIIELWHSIFRNRFNFFQVPIPTIYLDQNRNFKDSYPNMLAIMEELFEMFFYQIDSKEYDRLLQVIKKHFYEYEPIYAKDNIFTSEIIKIVSKILQRDQTERNL